MTDPDTGAFIWYELMTPDPDAAKTFYDAVVGWDMAPCDAGEGGMDYRMIRRADGGMAGGVLALTPEMQSGGAKPGWFGYVHVPDVDAAITASGQPADRSTWAPTTWPAWAEWPWLPTLGAPQSTL